MRLGIVGHDLNGALLAGDRIVELAELPQCDAEVAVCLGIAGQKCNGVAEALSRQFRLFLELQDRAKIIVRLGVLRHSLGRLKANPLRFLQSPGLQVARGLFQGFHFQIGLPEPGRPYSGHLRLTVSMISSLMQIFSPQSRLVSGRNLLVASRPILEPRPASGEAKSR